MKHILGKSLEKLLRHRCRRSSEKLEGEVVGSSKDAYITKTSVDLRKTILVKL